MVGVVEFQIHISQSTLCVCGREGVNSVIVRVVRTWKRENDQAGNGGRSDDRAGSDVQSDILYKKKSSKTRSSSEA